MAVVKEVVVMALLLQRMQQTYGRISLRMRMVVQVAVVLVLKEEAAQQALAAGVQVVVEEVELGLLSILTNSLACLQVLE